MRSSKLSAGVLAVLSLALLVGPAWAGWEEGVAAFKQGNLQQAAAEFQEVVDQSPDGWQGHYMLGLVLQRQKKNQQALEHLRKAYDLNPNDLSIKSELGKSYHKANRFAEAAKVLNSVDASALPSDRRAAFYQLRGNSRLKSGNDGGALQDLAQLAKLKPSDAAIQYNYGLVALRAGNVDSAVAALGKAAQSGDAKMRKAYAQALVKKARELPKGNPAKKSSYAQAATAATALVSGDASFENLMLLLSAQLGAGQYPQAAKTGEQASAKKPNDWLPLFYTGQAYTSAGNYGAAQGPLEKALQVASPTNQRKVWQQLGFSYEKQKEFPRAIDAYRNAGDSSAVARVEKNRDTALENDAIEAENERIRVMEAEKAALEAELEALGSGDGGV
ncbi:MAG: tetratricopeptide repeat protein [Acidobacteriota bacterium]